MRYTEVTSFLQMDYDPNFGALVRKKSAYPLDGVPMVVGIVGLLKQFHPMVTQMFFGYAGQFIRSTSIATVADAASHVDSDGGKAAAAVELPREVLNMLVFMDQLCMYARVPRELMYEHIPAYFFDAMKIITSSK